FAAPFPGEPVWPPGPPEPRSRRPKRRRSALRVRPSPSAPAAAPRPIGRKRRQGERLRRNRALGLLLEDGGYVNKYRTTAILSRNCWFSWNMVNACHKGH